MPVRLLLPILLAAAPIKTSVAPNPAPISESSAGAEGIIHNIFHKISEGAVYFSAGTLLGSVSLLTKLGWEICQISPWAPSAPKECLIVSDMFSIASAHAFGQLSKGVPFIGTIPASQYSWHRNQDLLSQIPLSSEEDKKLVQFLKKRWLAKTTGFYPELINWVYPCFGIFVQLHPESTSSYSRDPNNKLSQTYENRVESWKETLPHPHDFPLVLTRPQGVENYLPCYLRVQAHEKAEAVMHNAALKIQSPASKVILDFTDVLAPISMDKKEWLAFWKTYANQLSDHCAALHLDANLILCIQRVAQKEMGGIRVLPLIGSQATAEQEHFLLEWVSKFGLSANRVELDRWDLALEPLESKNSSSLRIEAPSREKFLAALQAFEQNGFSDQAHRALMLEGTMQVVKGLLSGLTEDKWDEILQNKTQSSIVQLCFLQMEEQLQLLAEIKDRGLFFNMVSHLEQIHANLSSILEISAPFVSEDFPAIYQNLLVSHPQKFKKWTSCAIHSSGMTSLTGTIKAVQLSLNRHPRVLYGENTYYENIYSAGLVSAASSMEEATEEDWKQVDLLLAQFNPALKRINFVVTSYQAEEISKFLHKTLSLREGRPLTLALDCTLDYIDSPRVGELLTEFQEEIEKGTLNVICYRSGIKFDLFGMDNYSGAPFYMIHNQDPKWRAFDILLNDPALITDRLSTQWFCLAYKYAAPQLESYRKQIFDNTRALLNKVPPELFDKEARHRIVPMDEGADASFLDIKIAGPWHELKTAILVGGYMLIKSMEKGHPLFLRPSLGFYHPNVSVLFSEHCSTVRLTLGLDPEQVDVLASCFEMINGLNAHTRSP